MVQQRSSFYAWMLAAVFFDNVIAFTPSDIIKKTRTFSPRIPTRVAADLELSISSNANELTPLCNGSFVALITPMKQNGDLDLQGLRNLLQFHLSNGTDGICILGTTAEASLLTMKERETILKIAVEECKGRIPLLCGTGTINPTSIKEQTLQAQDVGCDAVLIVTPYYIKPPQRALVSHYMSMADLGMPVVMYNVPGRTAVDMSMESIAVCAQHDNIVGVKEATGDVSRVETLRQLIGEEFLLYSGDDGTSATFGLKGGNGCISVTANVAPREMHQIMTLEDEKKILALDEGLGQVHNKLFVESSPIPVKWALKRMGMIDSAFCRPPLCELDGSLEGDVEEALRGAGLI
mmetsp:Transcript_47852/g.57927  ORF Transcript_47852/g.57927 Transcript_47852/m.57927 type:complete len:350 (-) Transcript_47852:74-1123(-)|eukprot:CAMPEP_0172502672 /NCGR_PEP_ID=MMETSP1066-20121228/161812_1 /TAXON_ID=671091 /ORGANISM="Coscinodiscus wailesii, Strain CCMP2513" /LENGTH=349 /DNA_ID=CAMNT_0013278009 /DNA_START=92 /DNA_END=1141 /DNA_ORIENTATION=-